MKFNVVEEEINPKNDQTVSIGRGNIFWLYIYIGFIYIYIYIYIYKLDLPRFRPAIYILAFNMLFVGFCMYGDCYQAGTRCFELKDLY